MYALGEDTVLSQYPDSTFENYGDIETARDLTTFVEIGLLGIMDAMASTGSDAICPACGLGVTPQAGDMFSLELSDFICADFDSFAGSSDYPARDCAPDDAAWAASPSVNSAPCCVNNTLARASLLLMAEYGVGGPAGESLENLLAHDSGYVFNAFNAWTVAQVRAGPL